MVLRLDPGVPRPVGDVAGLSGVNIVSGFVHLSRYVYDRKYTSYGGNPASFREGRHYCERLCLPAQGVAC
jgi:hypothetical protein